MSDETLTYVKSGGPPDDWRDVQIFDLDAGKYLYGVVEVDAVAGWAIRLATNARGHFYSDPENPEQMARERIEGCFEISRKVKP